MCNANNQMVGESENGEIDTITSELDTGELLGEYQGRRGFMCSLHAKRWAAITLARSRIMQTSPGLKIPVSVPLSELEKYRGQWVACSADGSRIIANAATVAALEERLAVMGEDPERVLFDRIEDEDNMMGGAGLT